MTTSKIMAQNKIEYYEIVNSNMRTGVVAFYKQGNVVTFTSPHDFKQLAQNVFETIGTLPAGFRPPREIYTRVANTNNLIRIVVAPNGNVQAYNSGSAITTNSNGAFSGAYIVMGGVVRRILNALKPLSFERGWA